jgi:hypothetical protein
MAADCISSVQAKAGARALEYGQSRSGSMAENTRYDGDSADDMKYDGDKSTAGNNKNIGKTGWGS